MKVGSLHALASETHAIDPSPTIRGIIIDPDRIARLCREIKGAAITEKEVSSDAVFAAAARKAFVSDVGEIVWSVWRQHFSDYTPTVDFILALCYVYAAAVAGRTVSEGWSDHCRWAQWLWGGELTRLIAAMQARQQMLRKPIDADGDDSPRSVFAESVG